MKSGHSRAARTCGKRATLAIAEWGTFHWLPITFTNRQFRLAPLIEFKGNSWIKGIGPSIRSSTITTQRASRASILLRPFATTVSVACSRNECT